ncbi:MAG: DNA recombination protein RmuC [Oscillospiraceae bacterium]|nr:DNA recombination protein RmuC [Oscillospiraceae bacterium]
MQTEVDGKLEHIRKVVDDRLQSTLDEKMAGFRTAIGEIQRQTGDAQKTQLETMDRKLTDSLSAMNRALSEQQEQFRRAVQEKMDMLEKRFQTMESSSNERMDGMKRTMSEHLDRLSETNQQKLDGIQSMVSEKLESRLRESFNAVSERLEQVHRSLGEMQTVAAGVGDLKKVLSNVKTRGIMGEIQLGMILDEILAPDQYEHEIATIPGSREHVEYAVRLPGADGSGTVYLPIDSKFPGDTFRNLQDAYESGDPARIAEAKKQLELTVRKCAADIRNKYVEPPYTTNFGVMFLPFEGLYAEVVNSGAVDMLQREYSITVTGPSTMAAMLNSLQMGFRTLAIQKRSNEVWQILGEAKGEFEKFDKVLRATQEKISKAGEELEKLVGTRTRAINRKLRSVEVLELPQNGDDPDEE